MEMTTSIWRPHTGPIGDDLEVVAGNALVLHTDNDMIRIVLPGDYRVCTPVDTQPEDVYIQITDGIANEIRYLARKAMGDYSHILDWLSTAPRITPTPEGQP